MVLVCGPHPDSEYALSLGRSQAHHNLKRLLRGGGSSRAVAVESSDGTMRRRNHPGLHGHRHHQQGQQGRRPPGDTGGGVGVVIDRALQELRKKGFVSPCGDVSCQQCNPKGRAATTTAAAGRVRQQQRPSRFTRALPYPSECVARRVALAAGCKVKVVNRHVLQLRLQRQPGAFHYFAVYKPPGVTSMRKAGGGGFGKPCRDFVALGRCEFGAKCRFLHPGVFQVQSVYHTLPLNWPPVPHVGRLDVATEGLLLFTDDGRLQSALLQKAIDGDGDGAAGAGVGAGASVGVGVLIGGRGGADSNTNGSVGDVTKVYLVQVSREASLEARPDDAQGPNRVQLVVTEDHLLNLRQPLVYPDGATTTPAQVELVPRREMHRLLQFVPAQLRRVTASAATRANMSAAAAADAASVAATSADASAVAVPAAMAREKAARVDDVGIGDDGDEVAAVASRVAAEVADGASADAAAHATTDEAMCGLLRPVAQDSVPPTAWVRVTIAEGRNRQVRRLCERAGLRVHRLVRWAFGPLSLAMLHGSAARGLTREQVGLFVATKQQAASHSIVFQPAVARPPPPICLLSLLPHQP